MKMLTGSKLVTLSVLLIVILIQISHSESAVAKVGAFLNQHLGD